MLSPGTHIFWEAAAIMAGLFLIIEGIWTATKFKKNKNLKFLATVRVIIGAITLIVDGLFFLPSWF